MVLLAVTAAVPAGAAQNFVLPHQQMLVSDHTDEQGFAGTMVTWSAGPASRRSMHLIDNTHVDPTGHWGGYVRTLRYPADNFVRICRGSNPDYPGFGMVVNHVPGDSFNSVRQQGLSSRVLFAGQNHTLYEYQWRYPIGGVPVHITVQWLFVTGRPSPIYAITYDVSGAAADALEADTRAPYGDLDWDGGAQATIDGVEWGDDKQFVTLGAGPVSLNSGFDYTQDNIVPYTLAFSRVANAEMGLVQTQTQAQHSAGGYSGTAMWGHRVEEGPMPEQSNWPFQLHQWQLPNDPAAKRHAWGSNYGAVGHQWSATIGDTGFQRGWPYQSYSVYVVNDTHKQAAVRRERKQVEFLQKATLCALEGTSVRTRGAAGIARSDEVTYDVAGLNPLFNTWELDVDPCATMLRFSLSPALGAPLSQPTFVLHGIDHLDDDAVRIDGHVLRAQMGYFKSEDKVGHQVWLTFNQSLESTTEITIAAPTNR